MIKVETNFTVKSPLSSRSIKQLVAAAARQVKTLQGSVAIITVGTIRMKRLNKESRGRDYPTDVISFAWREDRAYRGANLGEIYLCPEVLRSQANRWGVSYQEEFRRMLAHGLLHLALYDHDSNQKARVMFALQEKIVKASLR